MKIYVQLVSLIILFATFSCKETTTENKAKKTETQVKVKKEDSIPEKSTISAPKKITSKYYEHSH